MPPGLFRSKRVAGELLIRAALASLTWEEPLTLAIPRWDGHASERNCRELAMRDTGLPEILLVYPDEGQGFARPENNIDFFGRVDEALGGPKELWEKAARATGEVR